jgi:hypothetical protein
VLNTLIGHFLGTVYPFSKIDHFVLGELFIDAYRLVYIKTGLVKAYIRDVA